MSDIKRRRLVAFLVDAPLAFALLPIVPVVVTTRLEGNWWDWMLPWGRGFHLLHTLLGYLIWRKTLGKKTRRPLRRQPPRMGIHPPARRPRGDQGRLAQHHCASRLLRHRGNRRRNRLGLEDIRRYIPRRVHHLRLPRLVRPSDGGYCLPRRHTQGRARDPRPALLHRRGLGGGGG